MTPLMLALYDDYATAERVRTELVAAGFATDRVELTSRAEAGQADAEPGARTAERHANYFHTLLDQGAEPGVADAFTRSVTEGASAIAVHPRFDYEIESARRILAAAAPRRLEELLH